MPTFNVYSASLQAERTEFEPGAFPTRSCDTFKPIALIRFVVNSGSITISRKASIKPVKSFCTVEGGISRPPRELFV